MKNIALPVQEADGSRLRLRTLIRLRWLAVIGQLIAVLVVYIGLGFHLPIGPCIGLIALSAWLNIYLRIRHRAGDFLGPSYATAMLTYDLLQLFGLLYLTGGLQNPFSLLLLAPVTVSASTQPTMNTVALGSVALLCATILIFYSEPLPWFSDRDLTLPLFYKWGVWTAIGSGIIFIGLYAWRIANEARQMSDALAAAELVLAHEQKLSALDGLAAAAAHELGTPLATISIIAKELERDIPKDSPISEDIHLLIDETRKCREILQKLTYHDAENDMMFARVTVTDLIEEVIQPHRALGTVITVSASAFDDDDRSAFEEPIMPRNPGIIYGLGNIVENAVEFAESKIEIEARWGDHEIILRISDDGPGFQPAILDNLGEPYVTTRKLTGDSLDADGANFGMGLGFFIAKTLLGRSGAEIAFANRPYPQSGAIVTIRWLREAQESGLSEMKKSTGKMLPAGI